VSRPGELLKELHEFDETCARRWADEPVQRGTGHDQREALYDRITARDAGTQPKTVGAESECARTGRKRAGRERASARGESYSIVSPRQWRVLSMTRDAALRRL